MTVKIDGKTFRFFDNVSIKLSLDSIASAFSIVVRFNHLNPEHRNIFKPLSYKSIQIFDIDNDLLLTGVIVNHDFNVSADPELIKISGYSLGGVLENVTIPYSAYPLESLRRSLKDIAEKLLRIFQLKLIIDPTVSKDANLIYEKSVASPSESVKSYLSKLTSQRNIVLSHDVDGNIVMFRPNIQARPIFFFNEENTIKISLTVNGQSMHSEISIIRQPSIATTKISPVDTIKNPLVAKRRTLVKVLSSGTDTDTANAANNILAGELKNISVKVLINRMLKIRPGQIVEVESPRAYLYNRTRFMIQSVDISQSKNNENMSLSLVLPETYNGETPKSIFI